MIHRFPLEEILGCLLHKGTNYNALLYLTKGIFVKALVPHKKKTTKLRTYSDNGRKSAKNALFFCFLAMETTLSVLKKTGPFYRFSPVQYR